jgi:hypothetical protein
MAFPAKYDGTCQGCGYDIRAGELIKAAGRRGRTRLWAHATQAGCAEARLNAEADAEQQQELRLEAGCAAFESGRYADPDFDLAEEARERRQMDAEYELGKSLAEDVRLARMIGGEAAAIEMEIHQDNLYGY